MPDKPVAVIDTQALLDWLVFGDPGAARWSAAVTAGELRWHACPRMRQELQHMLGHPTLQRWHPDSERALSTFDRHAELSAEPPGCLLRCRDADDQVFIDLALASGARWLITRDKALLALARRARVSGTHIVRPADWAPETPAP